MVSARKRLSIPRRARRKAQVGSFYDNEKGHFARSSSKPHETSMSIEGRSSDSQPGRERLPGELPVACCSLLIRAAHSSGTVGDSHSVPFSSRLRREPFNAANIHNLSVILLSAHQKTVRATAFTPDRMTGKPFPHTGRRTAARLECPTAPPSLCLRACRERHASLCRVPMCTSTTFTT